jgi:hypothetical protein
MAELRSERLAVLRDRSERNASEAGDLAEALKLAKEAHDEVVDLKTKALEKVGWRDLLVENTNALQRAIEVQSQLEALLGPLLKGEKAKAKFYETLSNPKALVPLAMLVILVIGAMVGAVTINPVDINPIISGEIMERPIKALLPHDEADTPEVTE